MRILEQFRYDCHIKKSQSLYGNEAKCWEARQRAYKSLISILGEAAVARHQKLIKAILDKTEKGNNGKDLFQALRDFPVITIRK